MTKAKTWFKPYNQKLIGFVVKTRHGKFIPLIARALADDIFAGDDAFLSVIGKQPPQETIEQALEFLDKEKDSLYQIFRKPNKSGGMMGHWLVVLVINEEGIDPREETK